VRPIAIPTLLMLAAAGASWAQAVPTFEVASIKVATAPGNCRGGPGTATPGQWNCTSTLRALIESAWSAKDYQLIAPASLDKQLFNIVAKVPPDTGKADFYLMLRSLLMSRMGVVVHRETREQTVFDLVIAKGGPKMALAEAASGEPPLAKDGSPAKFVLDKNGRAQLIPGRPMIRDGRMANGNVRLEARMQGTAEIANTLSGEVGHVVIDKTGLTDKYDYVLEFVSDRPTTTRAPAPTEGASVPQPSIFDAVVQQLGLKLEAKKAPVEMLVVDQANKEPVEN